METNQPKVTLLSWTNNPLETVYSIWCASRSNNPLLTPQEVVDGARDPDVDLDVEELFRKVLAQHIPVTESVYFNFMMENVSVSWREQAVRHRVGHKHDDRIGVDIIPDLTDSTWWSQSMRVLDMGAFADDGMYRVPDTIEALKERDGQLYNQYHFQMKEIQRTYSALVKAGVPMEDARDLIPLGAHHRISWSMNINSMTYIISKRSCWKLQFGLWGPIITGIVREVVEKVSKEFYALSTPLCIDAATDNYMGCPYKYENERCITGEDDLPVCPMFLTHEWKLNYQPSERMEQEIKERAVAYREFWGRDPHTGERL